MKDNRMGRGRSQRPESGSKTDKPANSRRFSGDGKSSTSSFSSARPANSRYGDAKPSARKRAQSDEGRSAYEKPAFRKPFPTAEGTGAARRTGSFSKPYEKRTRDGGSGASFTDKKSGKSYNDRAESRYGDKPSYGRKSESGGDTGKRSYGQKPNFDQRRGQGYTNDRPKPAYGQRDRNDTGSASGRERSSADRREDSSFSRPKYFDKKPSFRERENFAKDKRSYAEKTAFGNRSEKNTGERSRPYADRTSSERDSRERFSERKQQDDNTQLERSVRPSYKSAEEPFRKPTMRSRKNPSSDNTFSDEIRLNRYIANSGICSRRKADELIQAGVVSVNGEVVNEMGFKVNPAKDEIRYNGELLKREKKTYVLLNKPKDYLTTTDDPHERRTVMQLITKATSDRIYPIGRLDRNTTGLLLLTNDGDLAEKLSHPRNNVTKIYMAELDKNLTQGDFNKIQYGLELEDGFVKPDEISFVQGGSKREVGIQIHSGKNRIVRRIFEHLGYEVVKLDRTIYANLSKKDLPRGRWRYLTEQELIQLKHFVK